MHWSMEFEVVSLLISVLLLANMRSIKFLPLRSALLFINTVIIEVLLIIVDLGASWMDDVLKGRFIGLQIFTNTAYFALMFLLAISIHIFMNTIACEKSGRYYHHKPYDFILYAATDVFLFINLFNGMIFTVGTDGYQRGFLYYYIVYPYLLAEMAIGSISIIRARKQIARRIRYSIYLTLIFMAFTEAYQVYIEPGRLMMNLGVSVSLVIIYMAFMNTENDIEHKTSTFNTIGFRRYMTECLSGHKKFKAFFIQITSYSSLISMYGRDNTDRILRHIGSSLTRIQPFTFYLHSGLYAVVATNERDFATTESRISDVLSEKIFIEYEPIDISYRILAADTSCHFDNPGEMLSVATVTIRKTVYEKSPFELISAEDISDSEKKAKLYKAIYHAVDHGGVRVYYQPIYDNTCDRISSAEALSRIYDDELGLIYPDSFIPLFEQDGTILKFGRIMYENVCRFIRDNDMEALGLHYIEVNLSPIQCMQSSLPEDLITIADDYGVYMKYLNFEITETAALSNDMLLHLMMPLIDRGATFSVDDFGTGYSNLIRISTMPFRIIKIDKSILWDYFKNRDDMVPRIYDMMHHKGFDLVTEGVETMDMHIWLKNEARCKYEQGYLYSKPIDEQSFIAYLREKNVPHAAS